MTDIRKMHCKDIPDAPILQFIADTAPATWFTWQDPGGDLIMPENSVRRAMPCGGELPDRLVLAKMSKLFKRGLIDGCVCGCRGDFEITEKGRLLLAQPQSGDTQ